MSDEEGSARCSQPPSKSPPGWGETFRAVLRGECERALAVKPPLSEPPPAQGAVGRGDQACGVRPPLRGRWPRRGGGLAAVVGRRVVASGGPAVAGVWFRWSHGHRRRRTPGRSIPQPGGRRPHRNPALGGLPLGGSFGSDRGGGLEALLGDAPPPQSRWGGLPPNGFSCHTPAHLLRSVRISYALAIRVARYAVAHRHVDAAAERTAIAVSHRVRDRGAAVFDGCDLQRS